MLHICHVYTGQIALRRRYTQIVFIQNTQNTGILRKLDTNVNDTWQSRTETQEPKYKEQTLSKKIR